MKISQPKPFAAATIERLEGILPILPILPILSSFLVFRVCFLDADLATRAWSGRRLASRITFLLAPIT